MFPTGPLQIIFSNFGNIFLSVLSKFLWVVLPYQSAAGLPNSSNMLRGNDAISLIDFLIFLLNVHSMVARPMSMDVILL